MVDSIKELFKETEEFDYFIKGYFDYLRDILSTIDSKQLSRFVKEIDESKKNGSTIYVIGNGGSAATASHMANDFGETAFKNDDSDGAYKFLSLTDNAPLISAIANDDGYDKIFTHQLMINYRQGDKLIAITASGNYENIISAVKWVKEKGGTVIGLVGFDGGKLAELSDILIHVKTNKGEYGPVEDVHMIIDHLITTWLQRPRYFG